MDDEAALLARDVANAATAWFNAPHDTEAYRRLSQAVQQWNAYCQPKLGTSLDVDELLDELADSHHPPTPLGEGIAGLEQDLRRQARRVL